MRGIVSSAALQVALVLVPACAAPAAHAGSPAACPPPGWTRASLAALKADGFALDADRRAALAEGLPACLGDPDPALRDGVAYEALSKWMREGDFAPDALRRLRDTLYAMLDGADPQGFGRPFAALALSEVARTDRIAPWMTDDERAAMVARASAFEASVTDDRGYDQAGGWRHGVAHGADWLMQLGLNPALSRAQLQRILDAVAVQAVPERAHAYVSGEPERLARPVLFAARRGLLAHADWQAWFAALPPRIGPADQAHADPAWLARRHDAVAFLSAVYIGADRAEDPRVAALKPLAADALARIP